MVKFLARENETGRIGTYLNTFTIPNLNKEEKRIPISSVVLSSQRVEKRECPLQRCERQDRRGHGCREPDDRQTVRS